MFVPTFSDDSEGSGVEPETPGMASMPSVRSGMTATSTLTGPPALAMVPSERSGITATVSKVKASSDKKGLIVKVGKLRYKGQTKPYAIVPPELIDSQEALTELMLFWGLPPNPDLIIELNSTRKPEGGLIAQKNMPFVLQDVFYAKGVEENHGDEESGHGMEWANNGRPDQDQALYDDKIGRPFRPSSWIRRTVLAGQEREKQPQAQPPHPPEPPQQRGLGGVNRTGGIKSKSEPCNVGGNTMNVSFRGNLIDSMTGPSSRLEPTSDADNRRLSKLGPAYHASWTNRYVQRKVVEALSGVVSAADMLRGILLCIGTPSGNERLLEAALDLEGSVPTILAVDDLDKYAVDDFGKEMKEHLEGSALTIAELLDDEKDDEEIIEIDISSEENIPQTVLCHRTTLSYPPPKKEDSLFWDNDGKTMTGKMPWFRASHLIFSTEHERFQPETLGRSGHICINGGCRDFRKATGHIIREAVTTVRPCLLFNNTGAETQAYARLINEIERRDKALIDKIKTESVKKSMFSKVVFSKSGEDNPETTPYGNFLEVEQGQVSSPANGSDVPHYDKLKAILRQQIEVLLTYSNLGLEDANSLNIADALHIIDLYTTNPRIFHSVVVSCDPLNESPDAITVKMMQAYARADLEKKEIGAGNVDSRAVEKAWRLHRHLETTKLTKSFWRSLLYNVYIIFAFATTLVAVIESWDHSRWLVLGLAAVVSISMGILNLTAPDEQLNKIQSAQARILYELFHFCLRVGKYSLDVRERDDAEDEAKENGGADKESAIDEAETIRQNRSRNRSTAMMLARMRFSSAMSGISSDIESLDLYYDHLAQGPLSETERLEFEEHVARTLNISGRNDKGEVAIALSGIITAKDYHSIRLVPKIDQLEHREDRLRKLTRGIQITSLLASTAAVIVSATEEGTQFIPAIIALATGFTQYLKVYDYERRFGIASKAARAVASLDSYWQSLSPLKQFTGDGKAKMVHACEEVLLQFNTNSIIQLDKDEIGLGKDDNAFLEEQKTFTARSA